MSRCTTACDTDFEKNSISQVLLNLFRIRKEMPGDMFHFQILKNPFFSVCFHFFFHTRRPFALVNLFCPTSSRIHFYFFLFLQIFFCIVFFCAGYLKVDITPKRLCMNIRTPVSLNQRKKYHFKFVPFVFSCIPLVSILHLIYFIPLVSRYISMCGFKRLTHFFSLFIFMHKDCHFDQKKHQRFPVLTEKPKKRTRFCEENGPNSKKKNTLLKCSDSLSGQKEEKKSERLKYIYLPLKIRKHFKQNFSFQQKSSRMFSIFYHLLCFVSLHFLINIRQSWGDM